MTRPETNTATPQLDAQDFMLAEQARNVHRVEVAENITRKDIINPAFWAHVASRMRPYDECIIIRRDGTLFARAVVLQTERTWAIVFLTEWHDLTTRDVSLTQADIKAGAVTPPSDPSMEFKIVHKGERLKWCVTRQSDGALVREGEATKAAAEAWLTEYKRVITVT